MQQSSTLFDCVNCARKENMGDHLTTSDAPFPLSSRFDAPYWTSRLSMLFHMVNRATPPGGLPGTVDAFISTGRQHAVTAQRRCALWAKSFPSDGLAIATNRRVELLSQYFDCINWDQAAQEGDLPRLIEENVPVKLAVAVCRGVLRCPCFVTISPWSTTVSDLTTQFYVDGLDAWLESLDDESLRVWHRQVACTACTSSANDGEPPRGVLVEELVAFVYPVEMVGVTVTRPSEEDGINFACSLLADSSAPRGALDARQSMAPVVDHHHGTAAPPRPPWVVVSDSSDADEPCEAHTRESPLDAAGGDEVFVGENQIRRLMLTSPEVLPRAVVVRCRRALDDKAITTFELEHHFTFAELRDHCVQRHYGTGAPRSRADAIARLVKAASAA